MEKQYQQMERHGEAWRGMERENPRVKMQELTNSRGRPTEMCEDDLTKIVYGGTDISAHCS